MCPVSFDSIALAADSLPGWLDVEVAAGSVPDHLPGGTELSRWLEVSPDAAVVRLDTGTRLFATADRLVIDPAPSATAEEMSYLMYSWGTRLVLTLRRHFSLHASAFLVGESAVALIGGSGAGKSTTLLGIQGRGYQAVVDDLLAVRVDPDSPVATCSGWRRPVHVRSRTAAEMPLWDGSPALSVEVRPDQPLLAAAVMHEVSDVPLRFGIHLVASDQVDRVTVEPLSGAVKLGVIKHTVDSFGQASSGGRGADFFAWASGAADRLPMFRLIRPHERWSLDEVLDAVELLLEQVGLHPADDESPGSVSGDSQVGE